jgi:pyruvate formate lyase activating enzyme
MQPITPTVLAGIQKNSFIDYPGKISCVLFITGCNFTCPYCHNADLARGKYPARIESGDALAFLRGRRGLLEGVTLTGGEPTLDRGIVDLCRAIKSMGYPVKLDTNGSRPDVLHRLMAMQLVDFIAMDIKAPLDHYHPFSDYPDIQKKLADSVHLIMQHASAYEFRTTCAAPIAQPAAIETIARTIEGAACFVLQSFNRGAQCLDPGFNHRQDPTLSAAAMQRLRALAAPFVQRCIIR